MAALAEIFKQFREFIQWMLMDRRVLVAVGAGLGWISFFPATVDVEFLPRWVGWFRLGFGLVMILLAWLLIEPSLKTWHARREWKRRLACLRPEELTLFHPFILNKTRQTDIDVSDVAHFSWTNFQGMLEPRGLLDTRYLAGRGGLRLAGIDDNLYDFLLNHPELLGLPRAKSRRKSRQS